MKKNRHLHKTSKIDVLESVRGIAALCVAVFHFNAGGVLSSLFFRNAWIMVDFFFVLSGFVISLAYYSRLNSCSDIYSFQKKRFLRLYPLHILMLLAFFSIEVAKYGAELRFGLVATNPAFSVNTLYALIINALLIHNWALPDLTYNYPSWSISAEFVTYAYFAVLFWLSAVGKYAFYFVSLTSIILAALVLNAIGFTTDNIGGPARCIYGFGIGVYANIFYRKIAGQNLNLTSGPAFISLTSCILVILTVESKFSPLLHAPLIFGVAVFLISVTSNKSWLGRLLTHRWLVYLGTISYGVYMIHAFVWYLMTQCLRFFTDARITQTVNGGTEIQLGVWWFGDALTVLGLLSTVFLAHLSYKFFEVRFLDR